MKVEVPLTGDKINIRFRSDPSMNRLMEDPELDRLLASIRRTSDEVRASELVRRKRRVFVLAPGVDEKKNRDRLPVRLEV